MPKHRRDEKDELGEPLERKKPDFQEVQLFTRAHGTRSEQIYIEEKCKNYTKSDWNRYAERLFQQPFVLNAQQPRDQLMERCNQLHSLFCKGFNGDITVVERISILFPDVNSMKDRFMDMVNVYKVLLQ
jgi:hypothetical protein